MLEKRSKLKGPRKQRSVKAPGSKKRAKKATAPGVTPKANERRQRRRIAEKVAHGHRPAPGAFEKYVQGASTVSVGIDSADLSATAGGYGAKSAAKDSALRGVTKEELVEQRGFMPVAWNGM